MAIRVRKIERRTVALCAAKTEVQEGDLYLDDDVHYALACKFARDHNLHGVDWNDDESDRLAAEAEAQTQGPTP